MNDANRDHDSDCATHNSPAMETGPCDCGANTATFRECCQQFEDRVIKIDAANILHNASAQSEDE